MNFITTTLPYANSIPHVGHALEFVQADFWKRYLPESYLNIGLDEHGKKIYDTAISQNKEPQEFVDELSEKWEEFSKSFNIKYDNFYRTSNKNHYDKVQYIWNRIQKKEDIYLKDYEALYCKGCEEFKTSTQISNDRCIDHQTIELEEVKEKNYFFKISKYQNLINTDLVFPKSKRLELQNVISNGEDISISREGVSWGISVPQSDQTIYVWFEALLNYIFAHPNWNEGNKIQICGPDNLRFQGHFFQSILISLGLVQTDTLLVHGTILDKDGKKISKSVGNVIDPIDQIKKYGVDAVRYYFLKGISTFGDSNWDESRLVEIHNSDLADNYGNLISRVLHLIKIKGYKKQDPEKNYKEKLDKRIEDIQLKLKGSYNIQNYLSGIVEILKGANRYINEEEPWKSDKPNVLFNLYYCISGITELYRPVFGDTKTNIVLTDIKKVNKNNFYPKINI